MSKRDEDEVSEGEPTVTVGGPERGALDVFVDRQLAIFEALRRLGFPSEDIYVAIYNGGELFTEVRQGKRRFYISISQGQKIDNEAYQSLWTKASEAWNTGTEEHRKAIYEINMPPGFGVGLIIGLKNKGFKLATGEGSW